MVEKMEPIPSTVPPRLMSEGNMQREAGGNRPGCVRGERVVGMLCRASLRVCRPKIFQIQRCGACSLSVSQESG